MMTTPKIRASTIASLKRELRHLWREERKLWEIRTQNRRTRKEWVHCRSLAENLEQILKQIQP
jgi:hypothetical protein